MPKNLLLTYIRAYLANRPLFYAFIRPQEALLFREHRHLLKPPILDFGCGDGFFAHLVFGEQSIDVGLDVKNSRIAETVSWPAYKQVVTYDGLKIPFPDNHFGSIISNCVFEHLPDLSGNLAEMYRVLKPGGYLVTSVMSKEWEQYLLGQKIFGQFYLRSWRHKQSHAHLLSANNWNEEFIKNGFYIVSNDYYEHKIPSRLNELSHYLAVTSLINYKLTSKWVIFPQWYRSILLDQWINKTIIGDVSKVSGGAIFYSLRKTNK